MSKHGSVTAVLAGAAIMVLAGCTGAPMGTAPDVPGESSGSTSTGVPSLASSAAPVVSARPSGSATSARPSGARPRGSATSARPSGARPSGSATSARPSSSATGQLTGPAAAVLAYVAAINGHDYALAWWLGGRNTGLSYPSFVSGFSTTVRDTLTILSVSGETVTARLTAQQTDGHVDTYQGTYTVDGGVIIGFHVRQVG